MPMIHTATVLVASAMERASALMYFVTVTPVTLKVAIDTMLIKMKKSSTPLEPACLK